MPGQRTSGVLLQTGCLFIPRRADGKRGSASCQDSPLVLVWVSADSSGMGMGVSLEAPGVSCLQYPLRGVFVKIVLYSSPLIAEGRKAATVISFLFI